MRPAPSWQKLIIRGFGPIMRSKGLGCGAEVPAEEHDMNRLRLPMAQALVRYLAAQRSEIDGREVPLFAGVFAIFGHGNVAGLGEALYAAREVLPTLRRPQQPRDA